jgi:hypothetical protein
MKANTMNLEPKSVNSLKDTELAWGLNEATQLEAIANGLVSKIIQDEVDVKEVKKSVDALIENCKKCMLKIIPTKLWVIDFFY